MKRKNVNDEDTKGTVQRFCDQVVWLLAVHRIYEELFTDDDSIALMERTASAFFSDLNSLLVNYLLLGFAKITDPATTRGSENLTVDYIVDAIEWPEDRRKRLAALRSETMKFRSYIKEARNKILAHHDRLTAVSGRIGDNSQKEGIGAFWTL